MGESVFFTARDEPPIGGGEKIPGSVRPPAARPAGLTRMSESRNLTGPAGAAAIGLKLVASKAWHESCLNIWGWDKHLGRQIMSIGPAMVGFGAIQIVLGIVLRLTWARARPSDSGATRRSKAPGGLSAAPR
jgi:hypothetical protein